MRKILGSVFIAVVMAVLYYLILAIIELEFNPVKWSEWIQGYCIGFYLGSVPIYIRDFLKD